MWQEAKKQEKAIRGIMIDYKRRAERRKGFYDKIVNCQLYKKGNTTASTSAVAVASTTAQHSTATETETATTAFFKLNETKWSELDERRRKLKKKRDEDGMRWESKGSQKCGNNEIKSNK